MPCRFIHLTDPHYVPRPRRLYALDPQQRLEAAVADINARFPEASCVVITGDLTHKGETQAYRELRAALQQLRMPWHLLLGNHDHRERFREVFPEIRTDPAGFVQYTFPLGDGTGIALDTLAQGDDSGRLCDARLAWLEGALAGLAGTPVYLFMHHAPVPCGIHGMDLCMLTEPERLAAVLTRHRNIRHLFFGHLHRHVAGSWHGIPFSTLPSLAHQVLLQFDVPEITPGDHGPPAYAVVTLSDDAVFIHAHEYLDASPRYVLDEVAAERAQALQELPRFG